MSDIVYTPPASGGTGNISGTLTPTYMPYATGVNAISDTTTTFDVTNKRTIFNSTTFLPAAFNSTTGTSIIGFNNSGSAFDVYIGAYGNVLSLLTNGTRQLNVLANGNVGIGTTNPASFLTLSKTGLLDFQINATDQATDEKNWIWQAGSPVGTGVYRLRAVNDSYTSGINALTFVRSGISSITTSFTGGNVGIGTTSPTYKLVVSNSGAEGLEFATGTIIANRNYLISFNRSAGVYVDFYSDTKSYVYQVSGNEAMRINDIGNIGVGTSNIFNNAKLQIRPNSDTNIAFQPGTYFTNGGKLNVFNDYGNNNVEFEINGKLLALKTQETLAMLITDTQQIGVCTNPVASAQLQVFSPNNDTGFLCPQLEDADIRHISSPAEGLMVYNTTINQICFFLAGTWQQVLHIPM
jgi:hypothetical protein